MFSATPRPDQARIEAILAALDDAWGPGDDSGETRIVRAPGSVNLMGDHTELSEGFVLPAAIELETWIAFRPRRDGFVRVVSRHFGEVGSFWIDALAPDLSRSASGGVRGIQSVHGTHGAHGSGSALAAVAAVGAAATAVGHNGAHGGPTGLWSDYVGGAAWSLREAALPVRGFEGVVDTTIPIGIGLASSAALGVASALALLGGGHVLSGPA